MSVLIPDEVLQAAHMSEEEFKQEVAVMLFERGKLTMGQACRLAGMARIPFQHLLASRQIPVHYDIPDLEADLETLRSLGRQRLRSKHNDTGH